MSSRMPSEPATTARAHIEAFEAGSVNPSEFHHRDHVELTWSYLTCLSLEETLGALPRAIRRFATANGDSEKYHETITWAFVLLIHERMAIDETNARPDRAGKAARRADFEAFALANPDLFEWPNPVLTRSYAPETLRSDHARRVFVWPERAGVLLQYVEHSNQAQQSLS